MRMIHCLMGLALALPVAASDGIKLPAFERSTLDNGATLITMPRDDVPMVALSMQIRGGSLADGQGKEGTAELLAQLLQKGAGDRDAAAFAEAVDAVGGRLSVSANRESLVIGAEFLAKDAPLMVELVSDLLLRPKLEEAEFDKVRTRAIQSIKAAKDSGPDQLIGSYGNAWLFAGHPYSRPSGGDETSLAAVSLADLKAFRTAHLGADRATIAVVGDFEPASLRASLEKALAGWDKAQDERPAVEAAPRVEGRRVLLVDKPGATQTYFWLGNVGAAVDAPERTAQDLVQTVFGGRFTSMLNTALRVESGLTYGARARIDRLARPGAASIASFTRTDATAQALDLTLEVIDRLHAQGIDQPMLESGRRYMLGQFPPRLETHAQLAGRLTELDLYGLGRDEVEGLAARLAALDVAQVNAAREVFPTRDHLAIVLIGDAAQIREVAAKYGEVTEMALSDPRFIPKR
ncbi:M16 family metallopeptidase [Pseudomarimonas salicorniae]|uniref:Insulinase family protein n=1 Tax=Pseudomarimonas salicorniae TaxID=2933270 RepID=A0ABT0GKC1_9GAMM|nr:pitrilysin family protein [Lysobacter sp. CAU 1642]MCK7594978.1 insulinase family protein [Lysobacter sp. CAU 1642]